MFACVKLRFHNVSEMISLCFHTHINTNLHILENHGLVSYTIYIPLIKLKSELERGNNILLLLIYIFFLEDLKTIDEFIDRFDFPYSINQVFVSHNFPKFSLFNDVIIVSVNNIQHLPSHEVPTCGL